MVVDGESEPGPHTLADDRIKTTSNVDVSSDDWKKLELDWRRAPVDESKPSFLYLVTRYSDFISKYYESVDSVQVVDFSKDFFTEERVKEIVSGVSAAPGDMDSSGG